MICELYLWLWHVKNVKFIIYDGLVLFYKHCFSFNIFETVMEKYFKRKSELELPPPPPPPTKRVDKPLVCYFLFI